MKSPIRKKVQRGKLSVKEVLQNRIFHTYKSNCARRGLRFEVSFNDFIGFLDLPCHYCGAAPGNTARGTSNKGRYKDVELKYQGLDRKNSQRGYYVQNLVPCCQQCNLIKSNILNYDEMLIVARMLGEIRAGNSKIILPLLAQLGLDRVHRVQLLTTLQEIARIRR